jgi:two-component system LytT family response regulator
MIKTVIIEDERASQELLVMKLTALFPEIQIKKVIENVSEAVAYLSSEVVDLVFMDNQIKGGFSGDILDQLPPEFTFGIIYITAFSEYAVEALNRGASYYLLKPFSEDELKNAVQKVLNLYNENRNVIQINGSGSNQFVNLNELVYIESQGSYSLFHITGGRTVVSSKNLGYFEAKLPSSVFIRIHHSAIINMNFIASIIKGKNPKVILKQDGRQLEISQRKASSFYAAIKGFDRVM